MTTLMVLCALFTPELGVEPGDHLFRLVVDNRPRSYRVHVPPQYDPATPTPVVLIFHGTSMNAKMMASFSGLNDKADEEGFVAVYPNGTGTRELFLTFNAGEEWQPSTEGRPDDVKFTAALLDDLKARVHVDARRIYATGLSNGGMMCYRLAAELPGTFAAIAPVAGTMAVAMPEQPHAVSVIHFHGTADAIVPFTGPDDRVPESVRFRSVDETIALWAAAGQCPATPTVVSEPDRVDDGTTVSRTTYGPGSQDHEIVLYTIEGGGHTWPGIEAIFKKSFGRSTRDISANDLIWEFFQKHPLP